MCDNPNYKDRDNIGKAKTQDELIDTVLNIHEMLPKLKLNNGAAIYMKKEKCQYAVMIVHLINFVAFPTPKFVFRGIDI